MDFLSLYICLQLPLTAYCSTLGALDTVGTIRTVVRHIGLGSFDAFCRQFYRRLGIGLIDCLSSRDFPFREILDREAQYRHNFGILPNKPMNNEMPNISRFMMWEESTYGPFLAFLQQQAATLESVEGGIWASQHTLVMDTTLAPKRLALIRALVIALGSHGELSAMHNLSVVNIGLNAGHSAAIMLWVFPFITVYSFDVCRHQYVQLAHMLLQHHFGPRHELVCGDTLNTLPRFVADPLRPKRIALIFVDGNHSYPVARSDMENAALLSCGEVPSLMVIDDCSAPLDLVAAATNMDPMMVLVSLAWRHALGVNHSKEQGLLLHANGICFGFPCDTRDKSCWGLNNVDAAQAHRGLFSQRFQQVAGHSSELLRDHPGLVH